MPLFLCVYSGLFRHSLSFRWLGYSQKVTTKSLNECHCVSLRILSALTPLQRIPEGMIAGSKTCFLHKSNRNTRSWFPLANSTPERNTSVHSLQQCMRVSVFPHSRSWGFCQTFNPSQYEGWKKMNRFHLWQRFWLLLRQNTLDCVSTICTFVHFILSFASLCLLLSFSPEYFNSYFWFINLFSLSLFQMRGS